MGLISILGTIHIVLHSHRALSFWTLRSKGAGTRRHVQTLKLALHAQTARADAVWVELIPPRAGTVPAHVVALWLPRRVELLSLRRGMLGRLRCPNVNTRNTTESSHGRGAT